MKQKTLAKWVGSTLISMGILAFAHDLPAAEGPKRLPLLLNQETYANTPEFSAVDLLENAKNNWDLDGLELSLEALLYEASNRREPEELRLPALLKSIQDKGEQLGIEKDATFALVLSADTEAPLVSALPPTELAKMVKAVLEVLPIRSWTLTSKEPDIEPSDTMLPLLNLHPFIELPKAHSAEDINAMVNHFGSTKFVGAPFLLTVKKTHYRFDLALQDLLCLIEQSNLGPRLQAIRVDLHTDEKVEWDNKYWKPRESEALRRYNHDLQRKAIIEQVIPRLEKGQPFEATRPFISARSTTRLIWNPKAGMGSRHLERELKELKKTLAPPAKTATPPKE